MKRSILILLAVLVTALGWFWLQWKQNAPRRQCIQRLYKLEAALKPPITSNESFLELIILPSALQGRTQVEQTEFTRKALRDELSREGLEILKRKGRFGPLSEVFPREAETWSRQAGVKAQDCLAFRMEQGGFRAEVVLLAEPSAAEPRTFRILRCNNVKQMASLSS